VRDEIEKKSQDDLKEVLKHFVNSTDCATERERRCNLSFTNGFVRSWLGQYMIRKDELLRLVPKKCRAWTVGEVLGHLESVQKKAA